MNERTKDQHAVSLGRRGGKATSDAKAASSAANAVKAREARRVKRADKLPVSTTHAGLILSGER